MWSARRNYRSSFAHLAQELCAKRSAALVARWALKSGRPDADSDARLSKAENVVEPMHVTIPDSSSVSSASSVSSILKPGEQTSTRVRTRVTYVSKGTIRNVKKLTTEAAERLQQSLHN